VKEFVGALSVLSGAGDVCAQCSIRQEACVEFEVAGTFNEADTFEAICDAKKAVENKELILTRNELPS
jgi:hypothetical protein